MIEKFGSFKYAEIRTPYNPTLENEYLAEIIPSIKDNVVSRRRTVGSTLNKSDLTLKIVKSADNHLSVVNLTPLPTDDKNVPNNKNDDTTPSNRRKSKTTSKTAARNFVESRPPNKSYQVMRRSSMLSERDQPKKVSAVILKRKSIHVNNCRDVLSLDDEDDEEKASSRKTKVTQATAESAEQEREGRVVVTQSQTEATQDSNSTVSDDWAIPAISKGTRSSNRRQKSVYAERAISEHLDLGETAVAHSTPKLNENLEDGEPSSKIKRSERLFSRSQREREPQSNEQLNTNEIASTSKNTPPTRVSRQSSLNVSPSKRLRPFIEVKQEKMDECEIVETTNTATENVATTLSKTHKLDETQNTDKIDVELTEIKQEIISDDEDEPIDSTNSDLAMLVDESEHNISKTMDRLLSSLNNTSKEDEQGPITLSRIPSKPPPYHALQTNSKAKKSFPNVPTRSHSNGPHKNTLMPNKMVYIPIENTNGLPMNNNSILSDALRGTLLSPSTNKTIENDIPMAAPSSVMLVNETAAATITSSACTFSTVTTSMPCVTTTHTLNTQTLPSQSTSSLVNSIESSSVQQEISTKSLSDSLVRVPPRLVSKPTGALRSDGDIRLYEKNSSVSKMLMDNSYKMADFFRSVIEDTLHDVADDNNVMEARIRVLQLENEKLKNMHSQEIAELLANNEKLKNELKIKEKEQLRLINEIRKQCENERIKSVDETKKKQWCTNCGKEAQFYCCWNTSYCDYPCQQAHWPRHMSSCTQTESPAIPPTPRISKVFTFPLMPQS